MPRFGATSLSRLQQAHPLLQQLMNEVIKYVDCTILWTHRNKADQDAAVAAGNSQTPWPTSKHNSLPARAVDVVPYYPEQPHVRWDEKQGMYLFIGLVKGIAIKMGIKIRTGADWDGDFDTTDQTLHDLPHIELVEG